MRSNWREEALGTGRLGRGRRWWKKWLTSPAAGPGGCLLSVHLKLVLLPHPSASGSCPHSVCWTCCSHSGGSSSLEMISTTFPLICWFLTMTFFQSLFFSITWANAVTWVGFSLVCLLPCCLVSTLGVKWSCLPSTVMWSVCKGGMHKF